MDDIQAIRKGTSAPSQAADRHQSGDHTARLVPLPVGQELAGVPAGEWIGRGAPLLGLSGMVTEAEMEALFGQGLHPHPEPLAPAGPAGEAPPVRLGRRFIRPTYKDYDGDQEQELGEPEAVVPDDDGRTAGLVRRRKMLRGPVAAFDLVPRQGSVQGPVGFLPPAFDDGVGALAVVEFLVQRRSYRQLEFS